MWYVFCISLLKMLSNKIIGKEYSFSRVSMELWAKRVEKPFLVCDKESAPRIIVSPLWLLISSGVISSALLINQFRLVGFYCILEKPDCRISSLSIL